VEGGRRSGKILDLAGKMGGMLKRAGFVNVEEKVFKVPHGPWPKDRKMKLMGKYNLVHLLEGCGGLPSPPLPSPPLHSCFWRDCRENVLTMTRGIHAGILY